ncbi:MAG TPA: hypothetical protein PLN21_20015 [Gemmatales bacterium]|nr:hypothetical protein [Gemmatales bacterium]
MASPIITPMPVQTDTNYRPISRMAVIGLILSLPSAFIFASDNLFWLLFVVTLPAFILCFLAWKSIRNSQGNLAGEPLAILGIVISVACGLGWLTMSTVAKYVTESEARAAADAWIAKMQNGEAGAAFLMKVSPGSRKLDFNPEEHGRLRKQFPGQQQELSELDNFLVDEVCSQLLRYRDKLVVSYNGLLEAKAIREVPVFRFSYHYVGPAKEGNFVVVARAEDFDGQDGMRRDWVLNIDSNGNRSQETPYGDQLRVQGNRATEAVEKFVFAAANQESNEIQKMVDSKNQGELQTVIGYIRPKTKVGTISEIATKKPLRLRADRKSDNVMILTYDCTTLIDKERAIDFSIDYVADVTKPEGAMLQNCRFLGTRKLSGPPSRGDGTVLSPKTPSIQ